MTLDEAMTAHGPAWLSIWLPILLGGAFILPLTLLIWKTTRWAAVISVAAALIGAVTTNLLYAKMGYVKLLGLPHILVWTPLVAYLLFKLRSPVITIAPKVIMSVICAVIVISLAFDYFDVIRYLLGNRAAAV